MNSSEAGDRRAASWLLLLPIVVIGAFLRFLHLGSPPLFMDEIHAVRAASLHDFGHIFTHYGVADSSIPLTAWNRFLLEGVGLSEFGVRFPGALFGSLMVLLLAVFFRRVLRPAHAVLSTGLVAVSPYLVYLSREARPYPVVYAFFAAAVIGTFVWSRGGKRRNLVAAGVCSALGLWFNPIIFPAVGGLAVYALISVFGVDRVKRAKDALWAAGVALVVLAATMGPPFGDLVFQLQIKGNAGVATLGVIAESLQFLHATLAVPPLAVWALGVVLGLVGLGLRYPREVAALFSLSLLQVATIFELGPWLVEVPWVFLRYTAHLMPFFFAVLVFPAAFVLERFAALIHRPRWEGAMALAVIAGIFAGYLAFDSYALTDDGALAKHPQVLLIDDDSDLELLERSATYDAWSGDVASVVAFYRSLESRPEGGVIEAPVSLMFPLYEHYRRLHERRMAQGAMRFGYWMPFLIRGDETKFQSIVDLEGNDFDGFRYVVFHKHVTIEMALLNYKMSYDPDFASHALPLHELFQIWDFEYDNKSNFEPPASLVDSAKLVYRDDWIDVFDLMESPE